MASSGSATTNVAYLTSGALAVQLKLSWSILSQNLTKATSKVRVTLQVVTFDQGKMIGWSNQPWSLKVGGSTVKSGTFNISQASNSTRTLATYDTTIQHDLDGDASISASASVSFNMTFNQWVGTKSVSVSGQLKNIPRRSTPSISGDTMGQQITITTNRASSSFTHTIKYNFNGHQGVIAENVGASTKWTPDLETFAGWCTDATYKKCTIITNTYNASGTLMGTTEVSFNLKVPSSVVPKFTASVVSDSQGYLATYGGFVQGFSSIVVTCTAESMYGATIKSYEVSLGEAKDSGLKSSYSLGVPTESGAQSVKLTATDSRGRKITGTKAITVYEYGISDATITAERWNQQTNLQEDESSTVKVTLSGSFFDVGGKGLNSGTCTISYYEGQNMAGQEHVVQTVQLDCSFNTSIYIQNLSETKSFYIVAKWTDSFGELITRAATVGNATPVLDIKGDGTGVGIFTIADYEGLKIGGNIKLKPATDTIATKIQMDNWDGTLRDFVEFQSDGSLGIGANVVLNEQGLGYWMTRNVGSGSSAAKLPFQALYTDANGRVCMTWNDGGLRGKCYTRIWSGTCSGANGSVTAAGIDDYNLFSVMCADNVSIICQRRTAEDSIIAGSGGTHTGSQAQIYVLRMQESIGEKLSVRCYAMAVNANGIGAPVAKNITNIVGIL